MQRGVLAQLFEQDVGHPVVEDATIGILQRAVVAEDVVVHRHAVEASFEQLREAHVEGPVLRIDKQLVGGRRYEVDAVRLLQVHRIVVLLDNHPPHLRGGHPHGGHMRAEGLEAIDRGGAHGTLFDAVEPHAAHVVEAHLGIGAVGHRFGHPVGKPLLVGRLGQTPHRGVQLGRGVDIRHQSLVFGRRLVVGERHHARLDAHQAMPLQAEHRHPDVAQLLARLQQGRPPDEGVDHHVGVAAQQQVVVAVRREELAVAVVAHVRQQHQHVDLVAQLAGAARRRLLRVGEFEAGVARVVARRMARTLVVGHHADEADAHASALEDGPGGHLREGRRVAHHVGADHREAHAVEHAPQKGLSVVELMVAERRHVEPQTVHQREHRHAGRGGLVDKGVARPAVAGIGQHHVTHRVAAALDGRGQTGEALDFGVHVVGRQNDHNPFTRCAGHRHKGRQHRYKAEKHFHILGIRLPKLQIISTFTH